MIIDTKRHGLRLVRYKTKAPRSMMTNIGHAMSKAKRSDFIAASAFENALMDQNRTAAEIIKHNDCKRWLRAHSAWCAARKPRKAA